MQVQYRMHPSIASFASKEFYGGKIENGPDVAQETAAPHHKLPGLGPLAFYSCRGQEATPEGSTSLVNEVEADMVVALIHCLVTQVRRVVARELSGRAGCCHNNVLCRHAKLVVEPEAALSLQPLGCDQY